MYFCKIVDPVKINYCNFDHIYSVLQIGVCCFYPGLHDFLIGQKDNDFFLHTCVISYSIMA